MSYDQPAERYELDDPVEAMFVVAGGDDIPITVERVDVETHVVLFGTMSVAALDAAITADAFHLGGETPAAAWDAGQPVDVVLRLDPEVRATYVTTDEIFIGLFSDDRRVLDASAWYAVEATQVEQVPGVADADVAFGIRTRWAQSP